MFKIIEKTLLFLTYSSMAGVGHAAIISIPNPGFVTEFGVKVRNGLTSSEVVVFDNRPKAAVTVSSLNPPGSPVWTYGYSYVFRATYTGSTGTLTFSVDFDRSGIAGDVTSGTMPETTSYTFTDFAGTGFKYLSLGVQGTAAPAAGVALTNLVFNGAPVSNLASKASSTSTHYYGSSNPGGAFENITVTGLMNFSGNSSVDRPKMELRFASAVPLPSASAAIPETSAASLAALGSLILLRRVRRAV